MSLYGGVAWNLPSRAGNVMVPASEGSATERNENDDDSHILMGLSDKKAKKKSTEMRERDTNIKWWVLQDSNLCVPECEGLWQMSET